MERFNAKYTLSLLSIYLVFYASPIHQSSHTILLELQSTSESSGEFVNNPDSGPTQEILCGWGWALHFKELSRRF